MLRRVRRILLIVLACLAGLAAVLGLSVIVALRGSLPRLDGERAHPGLRAPVTVSLPWTGRAPGSGARAASSDPTGR